MGDITWCPAGQAGTASSQSEGFSSTLRALPTWIRFIDRIACLPPIAPQQLARDDDAHDLVGALQDLVHPEIAHQLLHAVILEIPVAAVDLQCLVADLEAEVR